MSTLYHTQLSLLQVRQIENYPTSSDVPTSPIVIADCGVLYPDDLSLADATAVSADSYEDYPDDEDHDVQKPEVALDIAKAIREVGNALFKEGKTSEALEKYLSTCIMTPPYMIARLLIDTSSESIRYLDVHPVLPETSPSELQDSYDALLAPLLLNSALAAIRAQPPSSENADIAIRNTTRALDKLELNATDKGRIVASAMIDTHDKPFYFPAKALYRRALAHSTQKNDDAAEKDLIEANKIVPDDAAISGELAKIRERKKEMRDKEKKAYKKLFA